MTLKYLNKAVIVMFAFVLCWTGWEGSGYAAAVESEAPIDWSHVLIGDQSQYPSASGHAAIRTSDGDFVTVGSILSDVSDDWCTYVVKLDDSGNIVWEKEMVFLDKYDYEKNQAFSIIEASDGSLIVGGEIRDGSYGRPRDVPYVFKLSPEGELIWEKQFLDIPYYLASADVIQETPDGGFLITGGTYLNDGIIPAYLLKIDAQGNTLWLKTYPFGYESGFYDMELTSDGGVIVVGLHKRIENPRVSYSTLLKLNSQGELVWKKTDDTDVIRSIIPIQDGNYLLTRYQAAANAYYLQIINQAGDVLDRIESESLSREAIGDIFFTQYRDNGYTFISKHDTESSGGQYGYRIVVTDEDADLAQAYLFGTPGLNLSGNGIALAPDGFFITGDTKIDTGMGYTTTMNVMKVKLPDHPSVEPSLVGLDYASGDLKLVAGQTARSVVNAVYSDSSVTDVTYSSIYESMDPNIASVDLFGNITGNTTGTTRILATYGGLQASITVEVMNAHTELGHFYLDSDEYSLSTGSELDVMAFYTNDTGHVSRVQETRFTTDDPSIAEIDEFGNIYGISPGITYITATYQGMTYRASVWVVRPYRSQ